MLCFVKHKETNNLYFFMRLLPFHALHRKITDMYVSSSLWTKDKLKPLEIKNKIRADCSWGEKENHGMRLKKRPFPLNKL